MHKYLESALIALSVAAAGTAVVGCGNSNAASMETMMPSQADLVALSGNNRLTLIRSGDASVQGSLTVTGVMGNLIAIDLRPANRLLYGLSSTNILYTINPQTGAATVASTLSVPFAGGTLSGMDFNPVPDRLRLVGANGQNFRINVDTGEVIQDTALSFGPPELQGSQPTITAAAYTNNVAGAQSTRLLNIDGERNLLVLQISRSLTCGSCGSHGLPVYSISQLLPSATKPDPTAGLGFSYLHESGLTCVHANDKL